MKKKITPEVSWHCPNCHNSNPVPFMVIGNLTKETLICKGCKKKFNLVVVILSKDE